MFSMEDFVMNTLRGMRDNEPEYRVRRLALTWYERDVLTTEDVEKIDGWYPSDDETEGEDE